MKQTKKQLQQQRRPWKMALAIIIGVALVVVGGYWVLHDKNIAVLNPQGGVAEQQRDLIMLTTALGMIVIVPVFIMLFVIAWRYREANTTARYTPNNDHSKWLETVWWGIPIIIILVLSGITWVTTHQLDPYKPLASDKQPLKIQVVAMQWKWLFLYPDQRIATVNEVRFPEDTPIEFELTADAPMSAFWIPSLGTQTYAMNGMSSKLHLQANHAGEYRGSNTNINGEGYADMDFTAIAMTQGEFDLWVKDDAEPDNPMDIDAYELLALPTRDVPIEIYELRDVDLYNKITAKYINHSTESDVHAEHGGVAR